MKGQIKARHGGRRGLGWLGVVTLVPLGLLVATGPLGAGVVYEIEVKDHDSSPPKTESIEAAVEGKNLKMGIPSGGGRGGGDMIYRGDRREMVVVEHGDKSYMVMDEEAMSQIAGQVGGMMDEVKKALENVPADQRAMVEKMMKERMPQGMAGQAPERPRSELRKIGERATRNGYPCVKYEVWRADRKIRELWVTDWDNVEGGEDVVSTFEDMADFFRELMDSLPDFGQGDNFGDPAFEHMRELGGFPVVTREFGDDGSLEAETTLRSAERRTLDPADFEPPSGYKRRQMFPN